MTFEQFMERNRLIGERLDWIAKRTENMAWLGIANTSNPDFVELMNLQQQLLDTAERLISKFEAEGTV
jgi:hypothetical protein